MRPESSLLLEIVPHLASCGKGISGVRLFAPTGVGGSAVQINPPLVITRDALSEGLEVLISVAGL